VDFVELLDRIQVEGLRLFIMRPGEVQGFELENPMCQSYTGGVERYNYHGFDDKTQQSGMWEDFFTLPASEWVGRCQHPSGACDTSVDALSDRLHISDVV